jgi:benzoyl-CoA reductase/2-hydroxyglutaryl-CoA dehydratase subunit BcrC/BadD/HgdB
MCRMIEEMDINGVIFSSNRSCKVYSVMQMDLMKMIEERYQIPTVMIDVDHADPRQYNEEKEFLKLETMLKG